MGIARTRSFGAVVAFALVAIACGGGGSETTDSTRPPITTTLPPDVLATTIAPPNTTTSTTTAPTTTRDPIPESIGGRADPSVSIVPTGAQRFFYAGSDEASSLKTNGLGADQVVYYDLYAPAGIANGLTAIYLHDGAFDGGYANAPDAQAACRQLTSLGTWCVSVEYRRGFAGFATVPDGSRDLSPTQADRFRIALRDARNDALEALFHLDAAAVDLGVPQRYVLLGEGSGALLASDIALATPDLPYDFAGAALISGSHEAGKPLVGTPEFPVVIQSGLLDAVFPVYIGNLYLDDDMPIVVGARSLYDQLEAAGATVRLFLGAQDGHGAGLFRTGDQIPLFNQTIQLALDEGATGAFIEYRFRCDDANFGAATPGLTVSTATVASFRYEPYESDLQSGLTPDQSLELHPLETTNCL